MTVLALDTSFGACSVALATAVDGHVKLSAVFEAMDKGHSERIVPMISEVLVAAGRALSDVSLIAVTTGPGSFTGVRTGISVARALALANGLPVCGTTSLHVIAEGLSLASPTKPVAIAVSTRDGLVYFQTFDGSPARPDAAARLLAPSQAAEALASKDYLIAGTGAALVAGAARTLGIELEVHAARVNPDAAVLARLAPSLPILSPPRPLYLREPDATPGPNAAIQRIRTSA